MPQHKDIIDLLVDDWKQERPELNAEAMHVVGRILKLGKVLEKQAGTALKSSNIHYTDLDVLATIRRSGPPYQLAPKQLMESVLITSGAMTALLERLTKLELISRMPAEHDGRVKLAALTNKGKQVIDEAIVVRFAQANSAVKGLTRTEQKALGGLLKKMLNYLEMDYESQE